MNALPYLLNVSLYLLLFYGCYELLLRRNTFFGLNRVYLLASVILSLLLPLVELPGGAANSLPVGMITLPTFTVGNPQSASTNGLSVTQWFWLVYGVGVAIMLVRLGLNLWAVFRLIRRGTTESKGTCTLVRLPDDSTPSFSFGRYLVLNHADALTEPKALMRHEEAHIRQGHTADVLFLEIVQIAFWFNPVLWLYKHAIQEIHEFLADRAALAQENLKLDYARQLVAYALNIPSAELTTPFVSKSTLKQRIVMLQKPQTHRRAILGYAFVLPLAALLVMCTQSEHDPQSEGTLSTTTQTQARKAVKVDGEIFTVVEEQPEFQGGMAGLGSYLGKNLRYPAAAQKAKAEGRVFVSFVVTKSGEITDVEILKGIGYGADEEAIRVVQNMPRWQPAKQNGQLVNVKFNLPINFQLEDDESTAFKGIETFMIDGKVTTRQEVKALSPDKISRMDVDKERKTITIMTK
ncbi:M56 family metallopeptidase [Spirosoma flavum]|uniref:TonB family protein n=1 Tax=Spirosoma flavum TaxID=2048557 RepID=A0ABW6AJP8_9BACT